MNDSEISLNSRIQGLEAGLAYVMQGYLDLSPSLQLLIEIQAVSTELMRLRRYQAQFKPDTTH